MAAASSCLIYVNGPTAALGLVLVSAIMGVTATSGERVGEVTCDNSSIYIFQPRPSVWGDCPMLA